MHEMGTNGNKKRNTEREGREEREKIEEKKKDVNTG